MSGSEGQYIGSPRVIGACPDSSGWRGGEPTGIADVETDSTIDTSKGIYNLQGVRMSATSLEELHRGIYIYRRWKKRL